MERRCECCGRAVPAGVAGKKRDCEGCGMPLEDASAAQPSPAAASPAPVAKPAKKISTEQLRALFPVEFGDYFPRDDEADEGAEPRPRTAPRPAVSATVAPSPPPSSTAPTTLHRTIATEDAVAPTTLHRTGATEDAVATSPPIDVAPTPPRAEARRSRPVSNVALVGAALVAVAIASLAVARARSRSVPPASQPPSTPIAAAAPAPAPPPLRPDAPVAPSPPSAPPALAAAAPDPAPDPALDEEPTPRHRSHAPAMLDGKAVVLDYDAHPGSAGGVVAGSLAPVATDDRDRIEPARAAYLRGNAALFTGDTARAIAAYRQALSIYPGYAAGYRGLGLAYEEEGKRTEAADAFGTYLKAVPDARDATILRKRMQRLAKH